LKNVTVYSQPACQPCKFTKMKLAQLGVEYETVQLDEDPTALEKIKAMGYSAAPVVVVDLGDGATWTWAGYRPSEIERLVSLAAA